MNPDRLLPDPDATEALATALARTQPERAVVWKASSAPGNPPWPAPGCARWA